RYRNDADAARPLVREAHALAERLDDLTMIAWATQVDGFANICAGDAPAAVPLFEQALADFRALHAPVGTLVSLFYQTTVLALVEDPSRANAPGSEALALSESLGEYWMRAWTRWTLGLAA